MLTPTDLIALLSVILPILVPVAFAIWKPLQVYFAAKMHAHLPQMESQLLSDIAANVVVAVQQQFSGLDGGAKKKMAMDKAKEIAGTVLKGKVNETELDVLIENAVAALKATQPPKQDTPVNPPPDVSQTVGFIAPRQI